jgi:hypothetical protein
MSGVDDNKKLGLKEYREYLYNHIANHYNNKNSVKKLVHLSERTIEYKVATPTRKSRRVLERKPSKFEAPKNEPSLDKSASIK